MPRFNPDLGGIRSGFRIFPRNDYEVKITNVKGFAYEREDQKTGDVDDVSGVTLSLEMIGVVGNDGSIRPWLDDEEDIIAGERVSPLRLYVHSESALPITKRLLMAAYGYTVETEADFNEFIAAQELSFAVEGEPEEDGRAQDVELGDGWTGLVGKRFRTTLSQRTYQGNAQQDHGGFMPIG